MTLQNLRYIVEIANHKSFSKAASALYMTQSALSAAVKDVEDELGITIFLRSNRGVSLTPDGEDCLKYCKEIIERSERLSVRYKNRDTEHTYFSLSAQHLPFAVRAFDELITDYAPSQYNAAMYEVSTAELIQNISSNKSELGVIAIPADQYRLLNKNLYNHDIVFTQLAKLNTYVFLRREHPLGNREKLYIEDLKNYPYVTYDRSSDPIYYTEETVLYEPFERCIHVSDRATKMSVIRSTDAFSIGIDLSNINKDIQNKGRSTELAAIPYADRSVPILVGYLEKNGHIISEIGQKYIKLLEKHIEMLSLPGL